VQLEVSYTTRYVYDPAVAGGLTALRMVPNDRPGLIVRGAALRTSPGTPTISYTDGWGTRVDVIESPRHADALFTVDASVETGAEVIDVALTPAEEFVYRADSARVRRDAVSRLVDELGLARSGWSAIETLATCLRGWFTYRVGVTDATTEIETVLETGQGVCQDLTHVFIAAARSWGWCTRYVSGYVYTSDSAPGRVEASAMHAWAEVYRDGIGWVGLDPTFGGYADDRYVIVAAGRDYDDVRPVRGIVSGIASQSQLAELVVQRNGTQ
jgi:transglutaminase-like putative cysteine protease